MSNFFVRGYREQLWSCATYHSVDYQGNIKQVYLFAQIDRCLHLYVGAGMIKYLIQACCKLFRNNDVIIVLMFVPLFVSLFCVSPKSRTLLKCYFVLGNRLTYYLHSW